MTGPRATEMRDIALPEAGPGDGLLRVEVTGVCEFDAQRYRRGDIAPAILGHEIVGVLERVGQDMAVRWGVSAGDRVLVEEYVPCLDCEWCARGEHRLCEAAQLDAPAAISYGATPLSRAPGLWGGFAEAIYLHPRSVLHAVPTDMPADIAALAVPLANGVQWAVFDGGAAPGKTVLILGGNRYGAAAALAAKHAGAREVLLGVTGAEAKTRPATDADFVFDVEEGDFRDAAMAATGGRGADVVVDATSDTSGQVAAGAIAVAAKGGILVLGGVGTVPLNLGEIRRKYLTVKPVRSHSYAATQRALDILRAPQTAFVTGQEIFPLSAVDQALRARARHCLVVPN